MLGRAPLSRATEPACPLVVHVCSSHHRLVERTLTPPGSAWILPKGLMSGTDTVLRQGTVTRLSRKMVIRFAWLHMPLDSAWCMIG